MITQHAKKRLKERAGVRKSEAKSNTKKALRDGITHAETTGSMKRYIDSLFFRNKTAPNIRIYNYVVYIFAGKDLITVLNLPTRYFTTYDRIKAGRETDAPQNDNGQGINKGVTI